MSRLLLFFLTVFFFSCAGNDVDFRKYSMPQKRIGTELTYLKDGFGRYVYINGLNVSGSTKF
ncbi:MAG: hypothetical protein FJ088_10025, partial [Deltaproteobacteria bacterium]|nr:hypothetical protein [Deltaproteobacteria bacterium]